MLTWYTDQYVKIIKKNILPLIAEAKTTYPKFQNIQII